MKKISKLLMAVTASALLLTLTGCPAQTGETDYVAEAKMEIKKPVKSEEDVAELVQASIDEYLEFFQSLDSSRASAKDVSNQINKVFDDIYGKQADLEKFVENLVNIYAGLPTEDLIIEEKIDLTEISLADMYEAIFSSTKHIAEKTGKDFTYPEEDYQQMITQLKVYDDVFGLDKVYLRVKAGYEAGDEPKAIAQANVDYRMSVRDLNKALVLAMKDADLGSLPEDVSLPVKAMSVAVKADVDAKADVKGIVELVPGITTGITTGMLFPSTEKVTKAVKLEQSAGAAYKIAVCTKDGFGGYFTISISEDASLEQIYDLVRKYGIDTITDLDISDKKLESLLKDLSFVKINLTVSDGKSDTFTKEYKLVDVYKMIMEIVDGIDAAI